MSTSEDSAIPPWHLRGQVIIACNCDYGCPCNFNGLPSQGKCEGSWSWHIEDGRFGDVPLSGLTFSEAVNWPGAIHHGNGEGIVVIDQAADARQREAEEAIRNDPEVQSMMRDWDARIVPGTLRPA